MRLKKRSVSVASHVDGEGSKKRKVKNMDSYEETGAEAESNGPFAPKKVNLDPNTIFAAHGLGDQTSNSGIGHYNVSSRVPVTPPRAYSSRATSNAASRNDDTDSDSDGLVVANETLFFSREDANPSPLSRLPYGRLLKEYSDTPIPASLELADDIRRRRRLGKGLIDFEIYEDPEERQRLLQKIHQSDSIHLSSPSEDKENSDESLGLLDSEATDVEATETEEETEADDEDVEDEEEEEFETGGSGHVSEFVPSSSSGSGFFRVTPPVTRLWRHSATAANRGR